MSKKSKKVFMPNLAGGMFLGVAMCAGSAVVAIASGLAVKAIYQKLK